MMMPVERHIPPPVFTRQIRDAIKLRVDPETLAYINALEDIALAADAHVQAHESETKMRVRVNQRLVLVNFMK